MRRVERFAGDHEMRRLVGLLGEHIEAQVLALVVRKPDGTLAVVAPTALPFGHRLAQCLGQIGKEPEQ